MTLAGTHYITHSHRLLSAALNSPSSLRLCKVFPFSNFNLYRPRRTLSTMAESGFYSLKATLPGSKTFDFADLKGKTVLIVNTASAWCVVQVDIQAEKTRLIRYPPLVDSPRSTRVCSHRCLFSQALSDIPSGLQELYEKHKDNGFIILGFPCNQVWHKSAFLRRRHISSFVVRRTRATR